ncbi:hypothetical protein QTO34_006119 [Cnephaeus nilssonii]|uniref:Storkhead box 1 n=1 Tax=Cnephaeus nilssonii TaxID=3371016 RepID=A0AA40HMX9_CNENI|nr:hypothetical protein QTO34_006119 [Eptesicus nilssonii]
MHQECPPQEGNPHQEKSASYNLCRTDISKQLKMSNTSVASVAQWLSVNLRIRRSRFDSRPESLYLYPKGRAAGTSSPLAPGTQHPGRDLGFPLAAGRHWGPGFPRSPGFVWKVIRKDTYFITNTNPQENKRVRSDESHEIPACITYLVSVESCAEFAELAKENAAPVSHCPSCQCFPDVCTQDPQEPPAAAEATRKGQKGLGEPKSLVQNRAVSVSEENHVSESTKPLPYTRDRDRGKKFGFSLFWRGMSRKEKSRTEHSSFSAQFPPEEWPVRDEDNLDNIPRDIEHEIIKRINPVLTVDNLIKHTILMQKYEEQKKYNSQGTSTDMLTVGHKYPSREGGTQSGCNYEEDPSVAECVQTSASAERSIFDYYSSRKASSEAETPRDCVGDTGKKAACWSQSAQNQEMRKQFTQKLELFNTTHMPVMAQDIQHEHSHLEGTENHSMAGDSGIDSPRRESLE